MRRELMTATSDFRKIIRDNGFYVDKTQFIEDVLKNSSVKLFTRPRRFGKTLNLSMLKYFFDMNEVEENRKLFKGLNVEKTQTMKHFGQYPVIFLSFKDVKSKDASENLKIVKNMISDMYHEFNFLKKELSGRKLKEFEAIINGEEADYSMAIKSLAEYLHNYYKKEVVVLIDEYDTPLIEAHINNYYDEVINFYRILYQSTLKDATFLKLGVLTGINRIARENIFSGLNNIDVNTVLTDEFEEYFGFTELEVKKALKEYELENTFAGVKHWYNGYNFNGKEIYNPWSIVNYLKNGKLIPNWVNSSENLLISDSLKNISRTENKEIIDSLDKLFQGEIIDVEIDQNTIFENLKRPNELWNLMLNSGYLTIAKEINYRYYELKIPNFEIEEFFLEMFRNRIIEDNSKHFFKCSSALIKGNLEKFSEELKENVLNSVSFSEKNKESFYHGYMVMFANLLKGSHYIKSEREAGFGKLDIYVEPKNKEEFGYIMEIKHIKELKTEKRLVEKMKKEAKEALEQIKQNKYYEELLERNIENVGIISLVFSGKRVEVDFEKIK